MPSDPSPREELLAEISDAIEKRFLPTPQFQMALLQSMWLLADRGSCPHTCAEALAILRGEIVE